jgi:hypothetical protein
MTRRPVSFPLNGPSKSENLYRNNTLDPICISDGESDPGYNDPPDTEFEACKEFKDLQRKYHNGEDIGQYAGYFKQFSSTKTGSKPVTKSRPRWTGKRRRMPTARKSRYLIKLTYEKIVLLTNS